MFCNVLSVCKADLNRPNKKNPPGKAFFLLILHILFSANVSIDLTLHVTFRHCAGLPAYELLLLLRSERALHDRVFEAVDQLMNSGYNGEEPAESGGSPGETRQEAAEKADDSTCKGEKGRSSPA